MSCTTLVLLFLAAFNLLHVTRGQIGTYQSLERLRDRLNDDTMECVLGTDPKNLTLTCKTLVDSLDVEFILSAAPCTRLTSLGLKLSINGTVQFDSIFQQSTSVDIDNGDVVFGVFPRIFVIDIALAIMLEGTPEMLIDSATIHMDCIQAAGSLPNVTMEMMCNSLSAVRDSLNMTEHCDISKDCLVLTCNSKFGNQYINYFRMELYPCQRPFFYHLKMEGPNITDIDEILFQGNHSYTVVVNNTDTEVFTPIIEHETGIETSIVISREGLGNVTLLRAVNITMACITEYPPTPSSEMPQPSSDLATDSIVIILPTADTGLTAVPSSPTSPTPSLTLATSQPLPSGTISPTSSPISVSKEDMCNSLDAISDKLANSELNAGCSKSEDCTVLECDMTYLVFPISMTMTLLPCEEPYGIAIFVNGGDTLGTIIDGVFKNDTTLSLTVAGQRAIAEISISQGSGFIDEEVTVRVPSLNLVLPVLPSSRIFMFCEMPITSSATPITSSATPSTSSATPSISSATPSTSSATPSISSASEMPQPSSDLATDSIDLTDIIILPTADTGLTAVPPSPTSPTPSLTLATTQPSPSRTILPTSSPISVSKEDMCNSLDDISDKLANSELSGRCSKNDDCTVLECNMTYLRFPISMTMTLLPCEEPYGIAIFVNGGPLGTIIDDVFKNDTTLNLTVIGQQAIAEISISQGSGFIDEEVTVRVPSLNLVLPVLPSSRIFMFCEMPITSSATPSTSSATPITSSATPSTSSATPSTSSATPITSSATPSTSSATPSISSASEMPQPSSDLATDSIDLTDIIILPTADTGLTTVPPSPTSPTPSLTLATTQPSPSRTILPTSSPISVSKEDMCNSLDDISDKLANSELSGRCSKNDDCTVLECNMTYLRFPISMTMTLLPCEEPYGIAIFVNGGPLGTIIDDVFKNDTTLSLTVIGQRAIADISISQGSGFIDVEVTVTVPLLGLDLPVLPSSRIFMFCGDIFPITSSATPSTSSATPSTSSATPSTSSATPSTSSGTSVTPSPTPDPKEDMCDSLETISNTFSEASEVSGDCDISEDCITLHCSLIAVSLGRIPINLNITLYPCEDPYAVGVLADVTAFNIQINDKYTGNATVQFQGIGITATIILIQRTYGVDISVLALGDALLPLTKIYMYCDMPTLPPVGTSCPRDVAKGLEWQSTLPGEINTIKCPRGRATRKCNLDGKWEEPDLNSCRRVFVDNPPSGNVTDPELSDFVKNVTAIVSSADVNIFTPADIKFGIDLTSNISKLLPNRFKRNTSDFITFVKDIYNTTSVLVDSELMDKWEEVDTDNGPIELVNVLEVINSIVVERIKDEEMDFETEQTNIYIKIHSHNNTKSIPISSRSDLTMIIDGIKVTIPAIVLDDYGEDTSLTLMLLPTLKDLIQDPTIASPVLSIVIEKGDNKVTTPFNEPVIIDFNLMSENRPVCSYYDNDATMWSDFRIETDTNSRNGNITCKSFHLTSFAVLDEPVPEAPPSVSLFVYIAGGIMFAAALLAALITAFLWVYECTKSCRKGILKAGHLDMMGLSVSMMVSILVFTIGFSSVPSQEMTCKVLSGVVFYFALSSFFWLFTDTALLAYLFTKAILTIPPWGYILILLVGLVLPALPVVVTGAINSPDFVIRDSVGDISFCLLSWNNSTAFAFIVPIAGAVVIGFIYVFLVLRAIYCLKRASVRFTEDDKENYDLKMYSKPNAVFNVICHFWLYIAMTVTWVFALVYVNNSVGPSSGTYSILFSLGCLVQGILVLLLATIGHPRLWRSLICCFDSSLDARQKLRIAQYWEIDAQATQSKKIEETNGRQERTSENHPYEDVELQERAGENNYVDMPSSDVIGTDAVSPPTEEGTGPYATPLITTGATSAEVNEPQSNEGKVPSSKNLSEGGQEEITNLDWAIHGKSPKQSSDPLDSRNDDVTCV